MGHSTHYKKTAEFWRTFRRKMKSSEYPEEFPRKFRGNTKLGFLGKNRWIPRKYYSRWRAVGGFYKIPRKFRQTSLFRRNSVGISSVCRQDLIYINKHSSSSSFTPYLHPPSYSIYTRIWLKKACLLQIIIVLRSIDLIWIRTRDCLRKNTNEV